MDDAIPYLVAAAYMGNTMIEQNKKFIGHWKVKKINLITHPSIKSMCEKTVVKDHMNHVYILNKDSTFIIESPIRKNDVGKWGISMTKSLNQNLSLRYGNGNGGPSFYQEVYRISYRDDNTIIIKEDLGIENSYYELVLKRVK